MDPATAKLAAQLAMTLGRSRAVRFLVVGLVLTAVCMNATVLFGPWLLTTQMSAQLRARLGSVDVNACGSGEVAQFRVDGGATGGLSKAQIASARVIWRVAVELGLGDRAGVVGIATAMQESTLRNIPYGDRDSVGLFQQRAGWGSRAVRMDPVASARLFYAALKRVEGWRGMTVTRAAQAVQRSAFPDAYAKHEERAAGLVARFRSEAPDIAAAAALSRQSSRCGAADAADCPSTGLGVETGLTPDALRVLRCAKRQWPELVSFGGVGDRPANVDRDHQEGRAVDLMIPGYRTAAGEALGDAIARWAVAERGRLGVRYVIWNGRIWSVQRAREGWRTCGTAAASCYSGPNDTAAHRDHVHVSVFGDRAGESASGAASGPVVRPLTRYVLTARFGQCSSHWARCHTGLDFAAPTGTSIRAIMSGTVIYAKWGGPYGNLTKIQHANGVQSWYAHQSSRTVRAGDGVRAGQVIGRVGPTGNTTGPHLHLEVRDRGRPVDPDRWLSARGVSP